MLTGSASSPAAPAMPPQTPTRREQAAFLTAATGVVVFAGGYRSTLDQGAVDQAAFAVPLDGLQGPHPGIELLHRELALQDAQTTIP